MSNKNCLPLSIYKQGRTWQILHHNATLKTRVPRNFIHICNFFTNENSFYSLVSITARQRQRKYIHLTLIILHLCLRKNRWEENIKKRTKRELFQKNSSRNCDGTVSKISFNELKSFSTIFHNFPFKISVHSNYLLLKILKRTRTDMNEYSNK